MKIGMVVCSGRTKCGASRRSALRSLTASWTRRNSPFSRYRMPPWIMCDDAAEAPLTKSERSTSATSTPCSTRSRKVASPLIPPPMIRTSADGRAASESKPDPPSPMVVPPCSRLRPADDTGAGRAGMSHVPHSAHPASDLPVNGRHRSAAATCRTTTRNESPAGAFTTLRASTCSGVGENPNRR